MCERQKARARALKARASGKGGPDAAARQGRGGALLNPEHKPRTDMIQEIISVCSSGLFDARSVPMLAFDPWRGTVEAF